MIKALKAVFVVAVVTAAAAIVVVGIHGSSAKRAADTPNTGDPAGTSTVPPSEQALDEVCNTWLIEVTPKVAAGADISTILASSDWADITRWSTLLNAPTGSIPDQIANVVDDLNHLGSVDRSAPAKVQNGFAALSSKCEADGFGLD